MQNYEQANIFTNAENDRATYIYKPYINTKEKPSYIYKLKKRQTQRH